MKRFAWCRPLLGVIFSVSIVSISSAADGNAIVSREAAGEDFAIQGEYSGTLERDGEQIRQGVQVIALGNGKFDAVGYHGGLPGDGWDGSDRVKGAGERQGNEVVITNADGNAKAVIRDGEMVLSVDGEELGTLEKVERKSPTLGAKPPQDAVVLFSGKRDDLKNFKDGARFDDGKLREGFTTNDEFGDYKLHLEFMLSYMPEARGQGRSNSGAYQQGRYEVQILDSFGLEGADNECGGIYKAKAPSVNMCFPPLQWQTYDIDFTAAKYDDNGKKSSPARMTVKHNGMTIHDNTVVPAGTPGGTQGEGPGPGPLFVQNHGNPVFFRNIWVVRQN